MNGLPLNMHKITRVEGHEPRGQRHRIRSAAEVARCSRDPLARQLFPTHIGCFERVADHWVRRSGGLGPLVLVCAEGEGWAEVGTRRVSIRAGQAVWIDCSQPHGYGAAPGSAWTIAWCHVSGNSLQLWRDRMPDPALACWDTLAPAEAQAAFEDLWQASERNAAPIELNALLQLWLARLISREARSLARAAPDPIDRVAALLREKPAEPWPLSALAREAHCTSGHLVTRFRRRWGCPPRHYLIRQRLQRACGLLEATNDKIAAVASAVGYENPFYFSRIFSKTFGISPAAYRARNGRSR